MTPFKRAAIDLEIAGDPEIREACGSHFRGASTDVDGLKRAQEWRRAVDAEFGALIAFMGVNLVSLLHFSFGPENAGKRNFFLDAFVPGFGFVFCFGLLFSLQNWTKWAGILWLVVGILYAAYKTKGFTLRPKLFDFSET